jgi:NADPH:quinone reductase-like Zn-dependent oxidoreductase
VVTEPGGPEVFEIQELDDPQPGPEQVLVAVRATALIPSDLLQRARHYLWSPFK